MDNKLANLFINKLLYASFKFFILVMHYFVIF